MEKKLTYDEAVEIAKKFAQRIYTELDSQAEIYLYGSIIREQNRPGSDIDLAVVSKEFTDDVCANYTRVNKIAFRVNENIDAQAVIYEDWIDQTPFTAALQRQGVLIG